MWNKGEKMIKHVLQFCCEKHSKSLTVNCRFTKFYIPKLKVVLNVGGTLA